MTAARAANDPGAQASDLEPVLVKGRRLFQGGGQSLAKDVDIGEWADLAEPRRVRRVMEGLIGDGALELVGGAAEEVRARIAEKEKASGSGRAEPAAKSSGNNSGRAEPAVIRAEYETISKGDRGAKQRVIVFYADRRAALLTVMRLRTPKAIELQLLVGDVFFEAMEGRAGNSAALYRELGDVRALVSVQDQEIKVLRSKVDLLDPSSTGLCGGARGEMIRTQLAQVARIAELAGDNTPHKTFENELRQHLKFVHGIAAGWDNLPLIDFGDAMSKLASMVGLQRRKLARAKAELEARHAQMEMACIPPASAPRARVRRRR